MFQNTCLALVESGTHPRTDLYKSHIVGPCVPASAELSVQKPKLGV